MYVHGDIVEDLIATPARFLAWQTFVEAPLPSMRISSDDLAEVHSLRDATHRALSALIDNASISAPSLDVVDAALARSSMGLATVVRAGRISLEHTPTSGGLDGLLATMALHIAQFLGRAGDERIRRCARPRCSLLFVEDHHRRRFCHQRCSNAERQRRLRERLRSR
jgi:predicted RNA-binding Zn ribbon-like protein